MRFALSLRNVENLLAAGASSLATRQSVYGEGASGFNLRNNHWLWRGFDTNSDVLDTLMQTHRDAKAAKWFPGKLSKHWAPSRVILTDKVRGYGVSHRTLAPSAEHRQHKGLNKRVKASHRHIGLRQIIWDISIHPGNLRDTCSHTISRPPNSGTNTIAKVS